MGRYKYDTYRCNYSHKIVALSICPGEGVVLYKDKSHWPK